MNKHIIIAVYLGVILANISRVSAAVESEGYPSSIDLPGLVQAEHYARVPYDSSAGNVNGLLENCKYYGLDVDVADGKGGSCFVAHVLPGEALEYKVGKAGGRYDMTFRISSRFPKKRVEVHINDEVVGTVVTEGVEWDYWTIPTIRNVNIPTNATINLSFPDGYLNIDWFDIKLSKNDLATNVPGTIWPEFFTKFFDVNSENHGDCRKISGVDLAVDHHSPYKGCKVVETIKGEWIDYPVNVVSTGEYDVKIVLSAERAEDVMLSYNDKVLGKVRLKGSVSDVASKEEYIFGGVKLEQGAGTFRIDFLTGGTELYKLKIVKSQSDMHAVTAPSWLDFVKKKADRQMHDAVLPDFSYSGYRFSTQTLPDTSQWRVLDITRFGAVANDEKFDDQAIAKALDEAHKIKEPVVVYFPPGKFMIGDAKREKLSFIVKRGHIVLRGAGSGMNGTEIYARDKGDYPWRFHFRSPNRKSDKVAKVTSPIKRGDYEITVNSSKRLRVGQVVNVHHNNVSSLKNNAPGLEFISVWRSATKGFVAREKHVVKYINGKRITFVAPLAMNMDAKGTHLEVFPVIENVGVEGILFRSDWNLFPQRFKHKLGKRIDNGWAGLKFNKVKDAWVYDVEFKDWNNPIAVESSVAVTVENIKFTGKPGHTSSYASESYGVLFRNLVDTAHHHHGPGFRTSVNTVYQNCILAPGRSIDSHGHHSYKSLVDNTVGGHLALSGGPEHASPHHAHDLVVWNFVHNFAKHKLRYNFWQTEKRGFHNYVYPKFVGLKTPFEKVEMKGEGLDELRGKTVYPKSLFDAQLQLRLYGAYMSSSGHAHGHPPYFANDNDQTTAWVSNKIGGDTFLVLDMGHAQRITGIVFKEQSERIARFDLEAWNGKVWQSILNGLSPGGQTTFKFEPLTTSKLRLLIKSLKDAKRHSPVAISEFSVIRGS